MTPRLRERAPCRRMAAMRSTMAWIGIAAVSVAAAAICTAAAQTQTYPTKPIRFIVGPSPDAVARVMGQHLQETWGQPVVVETRAGAGGQIAAQAVASAEPDAHTFLFATPSYSLATAMHTAPYNLLKDFQPTALFGTGAYTLVVHPSVPVHSLAELIAYAKANPGKLNCGSAGIGTAPQIACETFNLIPGVKVVHIPYRGVNEAMNGLISNQVQMFVSVSLVAKQQMQAGTVRALATTGAKRSELLPELPTLAESGMPNLVMNGWNGLLATAGSPRAALEKVNAEVRRGSEIPAVRERLGGARPGIRRRHGPTSTDLPNSCATMSSAGPNSSMPSAAKSWHRRNNAML